MTLSVKNVFCFFYREVVFLIWWCN